MPIILNIETATDICSVSVSKQEELLCHKTIGKPYQHASQITLLISSCLRSAGLSLSALDAVAVSRGPGSYTSLRVGTSAAKGICYALDKPLLAVDTLESIALASAEPGDRADTLYCPMIDARRMEVYTALYDASFQLIQKPSALVIDEYAFGEYFQQGRPIIFSGNGAAKCRHTITHANAYFREVYCDAAHLPHLSLRAFNQQDFQDVAYYAPMYLKPPNITKPKKIL